MCQGGLFFHAAVLYCIFEEYPYEFVASMSCASCDGVKFSHDIPLYAHGKRLMPVLALHALWSGTSSSSAKVSLNSNAVSSRLRAAGYMVQKVNRTARPARCIGRARLFFQKPICGRAAKPASRSASVGM